METSIIIGIGSIAVGIIIGILTLWQTAGAKREKIKSSHREIITILIRSLTQSQINITPAELDRIVRSKCRNYGITRGDLFSDAELANDLFTSILENEFIAPPEKKKILTDIDKLINEISKQKPKVTEEVTRTIGTPQALISLMMAILGTILAMVVSIAAFQTPEIELKDVELVISIIAVILAMVVTMLTFERLSRRNKRLLEKPHITITKVEEEAKEPSKNE